MTEISKFVDRIKSPELIRVMNEYCKCLGYSPSDCEIISKDWYLSLSIIIKRLEKLHRKEEK